MQAQYTFFRGFSNEETSAIPNYEHFIETWRAVLSPNVGMQLALDMQENSALRYLPALLWNTRQMETMGGERSWRHVETTDAGVEIFIEGPILGVGRQLYKVNELIPQTRSLVPGHFQIDTATLVEIFIPPRHAADRQGRTNSSFTNNKKLCRAHLWNLFFKTDLALFKGDLPGTNRDYTFRHTVMTDGWSVTILLVAARYRHLDRLPHISTRGQKETYVNDLNEGESLLLLNKPLIFGLDPNCRDHLFVSATSEPGGHTWRYTSQQRLKESKSKARRKRREKRSMLTKVPTPEGGHISIAAFQSTYLIGLIRIQHFSDF